MDRIDFNDFIRGWARTWGVAGLELRVRIELSRRMSRALGRCIPSQGLVRLNAHLLDGPRELLIEVLCHEVAHVAAHELAGKKRHRPHGRQWAALMRAAGFAPHVRMDVNSGPHGAFLRSLTPRSRKQRSGARYEHRCPICQVYRMARRPVRQWRCAACVRAGLDGELVITRRSGATRA